MSFAFPLFEFHGKEIAMKKIINTPETVVYDMCHGLAKAHPELEFVEKYKICLLYTSPSPRD